MKQCVTSQDSQYLGHQGAIKKKKKKKKKKKERKKEKKEKKRKEKKKERETNFGTVLVWVFPEGDLK